MTNEEFGKAVKALESKAKGMSVKERNEASDELIERYVHARRETPPERFLERLANVILHDDLSDKTKRRKDSDRPAIYTEAQLKRQGARPDRQAKPSLAEKVDYGTEDIR